MKPFAVLTVVSLSSFSLTVACGSDNPEPKTPASPHAVATLAAPAAHNRDVNSNQAKISISEDIRAACKIGRADAHFAFDESVVRTQDAVVLKKLVTCFSTGSLQGRQMRLVGHTDDRGDQDYNYVLGERRANAVRSYLTGAGLSGSQATSSSRGELDATGTDESTWAADRRVDVMLAN